MGRLQPELSDRMLLRLKKRVGRTRLTETSSVSFHSLSLSTPDRVKLVMVGGAFHCNQSDSLSKADVLFLALFWVMNGSRGGLILSNSVSSVRVS